MQKEDVKFYVILILLSLLCLSLPIMICVNAYRGLQDLSYDKDRYDVHDFEEKKDAFDIMAAKCMKIYEAETGDGSNIDHIAVRVVAGQIIDVKAYFDPEGGAREADEESAYTITVEWTEEEEQAFREVAGAFGYAEFTELAYIKIRDDRVIFKGLSPYGVVYMKNGTRPRFLNSPDESHESIYVERLSFQWFEVVIK